MSAKPPFPWQLWILGAIAVFGLVAQLVAGEAAFALLGLGTLFSWSAALFFVGAPATAALVLSGQGRSNVPAIVVVIISGIVSAMTNFTWITVTAPELSWIQAWAFALGPLVTLYWMLFYVCSKLER